MTSDLPLVIVTRQLPQAIIDKLSAVATLNIWEEDRAIPQDTLLAWVPGCHAIYSLLTDPIDSSVLDAAGANLKVVSQMAVGVDNIDVAACTARGIPVGHTPNALTDTTADLAVALMLAVGRRIAAAAQFVKVGKWDTWRPMELTGKDLYGSTVGIIGFGRIGKAVAQRVRGFDCHILYNHPRSDPDAAQYAAAYVNLDTLLKSSDFISLHTPLTEETRHMIGAEELAMMKSDAIIVNTARGAIVDQAALVKALQEGKIGGAGLDVTDPEPISVDDPLLKLDNVIVVPHIGSASVTTRMRIAHMAADNLIAGLHGERLPNVYNPEVYSD
ncbi:MAG: D-glycerate dehydrogenase [Chloroflexi bacterium]|nr:D-glycerate dehydrogenase [Chloroflexota bacterium]